MAERPHRIVLCLVAALISAAPVLAQTRVACNITAVDVKQLSNAVRVTLKADGLLNVEADIWQFVREDENRDWVRVALREIPLQITNARSQVGTFVDIGTYPVSYLELTTPPGSREGVGLSLRLVLYEPALLHSLDVDNQDFVWSLSWGEIAVDVRKSQSGRELEILVWSDRHEEVIAPPKPRREQKLPAELSVSYGDGLISVDCVNAPLEELAAKVAEVTGQTVLVDDRVQRLATVQMRDMPIARFLESIAAGYGLSVTRYNGAWLVSDGLPSSLAPYVAGDARVYRLKYVSATAAIELLPNFLLRYLKPSEGGDTITAYGPPQLLERIGQDIAAIDQPSGDILVRVAVVEVTDNETSRRLWRLLLGGENRIEIDGAEGTISIRNGEESFEEYMAQIRALDTKGQLRLRAEPSLAATPGGSAVLFVGQRQYYQFVPSGSDMVLRSAEAGVRLEISPRAAGADLIATRVRVTVSTFRRAGGASPEVDTRTAVTTLVLGSGDTAVVGGGLIVRESEAQSRGPRPFRDAWSLSDITGASADEQEAREIVLLVSAEYGRPRRHQTDQADTEEQI
ncbi:MAG: type II secretion system protein GspD [Armatimonadota bacterium]